MFFELIQRTDLKLKKNIYWFTISFPRKGENELQVTLDLENIKLQKMLDLFKLITVKNKLNIKQYKHHKYSLL